MASKKQTRKKASTKGRAKSSARAAAAPLARFVNLDDSGNPTSGAHTWVFDRTTKLIWARGTLEGEFTLAEARAACAKVKFLGQACRAGTAHERFAINDFTRRSPALDTAHFKKETGWEWTDTVLVNEDGSPSDDAFCVNLGGGYCYWNFQAFHGRVRPVLAGQPFNFDF